MRERGLFGHEPALDGGLQVVREGELPDDLGGALHALGLVGGSVAVNATLRLRHQKIGSSITR